MSLLVNLSHSVSFKLHIALDDKTVVGSLLESNEQLGSATCDIPDIIQCTWYIIVWSGKYAVGDFCCDVGDVDTIFE